MSKKYKLSTLDSGRYEIIVTEEFLHHKKHITDVKQILYNNFINKEVTAIKTLTQYTNYIISRYINKTTAIKKIHEDIGTVNSGIFKCTLGQRHYVIKWYEYDTICPSEYSLAISECIALYELDKQLTDQNTIKVLTPIAAICDKKLTHGFIVYPYIADFANLADAYAHNKLSAKEYYKLLKKLKNIDYKYSCNINNQEYLIGDIKQENAHYNHKTKELYILDTDVYKNN